MTTPKTALDALRTFVDAAIALDRAWTTEVEGYLVDGYPFAGRSFDEVVIDLIKWRDAVAIAVSDDGTRAIDAVYDREDMIARVVKLYQDSVPHSDVEAALHMIGDILNPDADLAALDEELAEQEGTGPDLNVCADCGGSTAPGTPDPHVCLTAEEKSARRFPPLLTQDDLAKRQGFPAIADAPRTPTTINRHGDKVEITVYHGRFRADYLDADGSGEGMVHVFEERDGQWHDRGLATFWRDSWNDTGGVDEVVPNVDLDMLGTLISDALDMDAAPPLPSKDAAAAWISKLADALVDDHGDARIRGTAQIGKLHAMVESVGSFLAALAEDTRNATDAADYGRRVAQSLTGLLGGVNGDLGGVVDGLAPWAFAEELAP